MRGEARVGVLMERSVEMVVGVLGILKAGGAYVPLDPQYPAQRLEFMLEDAGIEALLTQERLVERLPSRAGQKHLILIDKDWEEIAVESAERVERCVSPENLAYIIYTSGSTGQPKGVMIQHRSAINLLRGLSEAVYSHHEDKRLRASLNAPLSFDASMQQLLLLLRGYTLHRAAGHPRRWRSPLELSGATRNRGADRTPSQLSVLLAAGLLKEGQASPRCFWSLEKRWTRGCGALWRAQGTKFFNIYGPTECTVDRRRVRYRPDGHADYWPARWRTRKSICSMNGSSLFP